MQKNECKCTNPLCAKCLSVNCTDGNCPVHTLHKKEKITGTENSSVYKSGNYFKFKLTL